LGFSFGIFVSEAPRLENPKAAILVALQTEPQTLPPIAQLPSDRTPFSMVGVL
jgi:hypothetical protein